MNLLEAKNNIDLKVIIIRKGRWATMRLANMGIREGVIIKKTAQQFFKGPISVKVGQSELAIGCGMAVAIEVEEIKKQ